MLGAAPGGMLGLVALRAGRAADEVGRSGRRLRRGGRGTALPDRARSGTRPGAPPQECGGDEDDQAGSGEAGQLEASSGGVSVLGRDKRPSSRSSC
jgi:hypothetical protein